MAKLICQFPNDCRWPMCTCQEDTETADDVAMTVIGVLISVFIAAVALTVMALGFGWISLN